MSACGKYTKHESIYKLKLIAGYFGRLIMAMRKFFGD